MKAGNTNVVNLFEQLRGVFRAVNKNDKNLRARIKKLEAGNALSQTSGSTAICEQWAIALRMPNERALAALPKIGFGGKPRPDFTVADYIDDSVKYIQTLQTELARLHCGERANTSPVPQRVREFDLYNRLVESRDELCNIITLDHVNDLQADLVPRGPPIEWRDVNIPAVTVTLLDVDGLQAHIAELFNFIRTRVKEKNWHGSQLNWMAPQPEWGRAQALALAMNRATEIIGEARTWIKHRGANDPKDDVVMKETPDTNASPVMPETPDSRRCNFDASGLAQLNNYKML
jgi:hypothetical protein